MTVSYMCRHPGDKATRRPRQRWEGCSHRPGSPCGPQRLGRARRALSWAPAGCWLLLTPPQTSGPQNCGRVKSCVTCSRRVTLTAPPPIPVPPSPAVPVLLSPQPCGFLPCYAPDLCSRFLSPTELSLPRTQAVQTELASPFFLQNCVFPTRF